MQKIVEFTNCIIRILSTTEEMYRQHELQLKQSHVLYRDTKDFFNSAQIHHHGKIEDKIPDTYIQHGNFIWLTVATTNAVALCVHIHKNSMLDNKN